MWERLGRVGVFSEPCMGTAVMLLNNPEPAPREVCCDLNAFVANFYRAVRGDYEQAAFWADWPTNHHDLTARHRWLLRWGAENAEQVSEDAEWYDAKAAGFWVLGTELWIGHGWCDVERWRVTQGQVAQRFEEQMGRAAGVGSPNTQRKQPARGGQAPEGARRRRHARPGWATEATRACSSRDRVPSMPAKGGARRDSAAGPDTARQPHARRQGRQRAAGRGGRAACRYSTSSGQSLALPVSGRADAACKPELATASSTAPGCGRGSPPSPPD